MTRQTSRTVARMLLALTLCGLVLQQALAASDNVRIYAPVVLKGGEPLPWNTATATSTVSSTTTATPTSTLLPGNTPTATGTATSTSTPSLTPTATSPVSPTVTATPAGTATATSPVSPTVTATPAGTATATTTPTATSTVTPTATTLPGETPASTPMPTATLPASTPIPPATPVPSTTLALTGSVELRPVNRSDIQPQLYVIVLDVSGSMNWNFNGQAIINGQVYQCGTGPDPSLNALRDQDAATCNSPTSTRWSPVEERRIYIAKQAVMQLIDQMKPDDRMQIVGFSGSGVNLVGTAQVGDTAGKLALKQAVLDAGKTSGDPYLTRGGTPTATGLYQARQFLTAATTPKQAPNGMDYQAVVLLMTDGVANYYRDPATQNGNYLSSGIAVGWENKAQDQYPRCNVGYSERVDCQTGYADTTKGNIARPVTAMVNEGTELQQIAEVYVVALAGVDMVGLSSVASLDSYPWFAPVNQPSVLSPTLLAMYDNMVSEEFPQWVDVIDPDHAPDPTILSGVNATTFGFVTLNGLDGVTRTAPIQTDPASGRLAYRFDGLTPGSYTLSAWIGYKSNDGITRRYEQLTDAGRVEIGPSTPIDLPTSALPTEVRQDVFLVR